MKFNSLSRISLHTQPCTATIARWCRQKHVKVCNAGLSNAPPLNQRRLVHATIISHSTQRVYVAAMLMTCFDSVICVDAHIVALPVIALDTRKIQEQMVLMRLV